MAVKKPTKIEVLENRISSLECAIYQNFADSDEVVGVIWALRNELEKPAVDINHYHVRNILNAIFTLTLKLSTDLMENSNLEY